MRALGEARSVKQRRLGQCARRYMYIWLVGVMGARWHRGLTDSATFWVVWCQNEMTHTSALPSNHGTSAWMMCSLWLVSRLLCLPGIRSSISLFPITLSPPGSRGRRLPEVLSPDCSDPDCTGAEVAGRQTGYHVHIQAGRCGRPL